MKPLRGLVYYFRSAAVPAFALALAACSSPEAVDSGKTSTADNVVVPNNPTKKSGTLRVLLDNNIASYYVLKGEPRGFDYEILRWFCDDHNLELEIKVIPNFDFILDSLLSGNSDLAAGNLTITGERLRNVNFTLPLHFTRQVIVQRLTEEARHSRALRKEWLVDNVLELEGRTVHVNRTSAFADRLHNIMRENGIVFNIEEVAPEIGASRLIEMVSDGNIDLTIADENIARLHRGFYTNLDISTPISLTQAIAWAIPPGKDSLKSMLDRWIEKNSNSLKFNVIYNKYFSNYAARQHDYHIRDIRNGKISAYDDLIKDYAGEINWEWTLLAALIQKESHFNPSAVSAFGATGLMQVMPATAGRYGVLPEELTIPGRNLYAGTRHLQWLENYWYRKLSDSSEVRKFVLASYNVGLGHVIDARKLTDKYALNHNKWDDNVEIMLKNKSLPKYYNDPVVEHGYCRGAEPVHYVKTIMNTWQYYREFTETKMQVITLAEVF